MKNLSRQLNQPVEFNPFIKIALGLAFLVVLFGISRAYASMAVQASFPDISHGLYNLANSARDDKLSWDDCLAQKAFIRAKDMVDQGYFSHTNPATQEYPAWNLIKECSDFKKAGENLAKNFTSGQTAQAALMASPTHRKNILDSDFGKMGTACYQNVCVEFFSS